MNDEILKEAFKLKEDFIKPIKETSCLTINQANLINKAFGNDERYDYLFK